LLVSRLRIGEKIPGLHKILVEYLLAGPEGRLSNACSPRETTTVFGSLR
jgi:hypothetical protein